MGILLVEEKAHPTELAWRKALLKMVAQHQSNPF
jgi:hypothetical protein